MRIEGAYDPRRVELRKKGDSAPAKEPDAKAAKSDQVTISDRARKANEAYQLAEIYRTLPDVRRDRVEESRSKMQRGEYFTEQAARATAERISLEA